MTAAENHYPTFSVTVDAAVLRRRGGVVEILLIQRGKPPFAGRWALPGGFVEIDEPLEAAARRELEEETGIVAGALDQLGAFGDPGRDPRGRVVSIVYWGFAPEGKGGGATQAGDDAAEAAWFSLADPPAMAFDHDRILARVRDKLGETGT